MIRKVVFLVMTVIAVMSYAAPYQLTVTPGNLKNLLRDMDIEPEELALSGSLNSEDLAFIREGEGRISRLNNLDLSKITLSYDDGIYASFQWTNFIGNQEITENFLLSDNVRTESTSGTGALGVGYVIYNHYTDDLSAFLYGNQNIRILILPESISEFGPYICQKSKVENVTFPNSTTTIPNSAFASSSIQKVNGQGFTKIGSNAFESSSIQEFNFSNINELGYASFYKSKLQGELVINGIEVIPSYCFGETGITRVTIGTGTKEIGDYAFKDCSSLTKVTLPDGIETLGDGAFDSYYLAEINLPNSLISVGKNALPEKFVNNMPAEDGVVYIGTVAYCIGSSASKILRIKEGTLSISNGFSTAQGNKYKDPITKIILPSSLTTIENSVSTDAGAFCNMPALEEVEFPANSNFKNLGSGAFYGCNNLKSVNLPEGLLSIGSRAFYNCSSLNIYLPNSLEIIGDEAFNNYANPYTGEIQNFPDNLQYIGFQAFYGCRLPSTITFGPNIKEIKQLAFSDTKGCYTLNLDIRTGFEVDENFYGIFENSSLEKVNVKSTCEIIPFSFAASRNIEIVTFENPDANTVPLKVCRNAFASENISIDRLPVRINEIESYAFSGVKFQQNVFDTSNTIFIGESAFYGSKGFEKVVLDGSLEECWNSAFGSISTLKEVEYYIPNLRAYTEDRFGVDELANLFYGSPVENVVIGPDVLKIPGHCFSNNILLTNIDFLPRENNSTPLELGDFCFGECNFETLILPDFPLIIRGSFMRCNIVNLDLGGTVSVGSSSFAQNYGLTQVEIPATVEYIGGYAFGDYTNYPLYQLTFESREETKTPLVIDELAFYQANISELILPDVYTTIGYRAFYRNYINTLHLGIGTTTIGDEAFKFNGGLYDINIPETVTSIGDEALYCAQDNPKVYFYSSVPPQMGYNVMRPGTTVVVPENSLAAYENEFGWCFTYGDEVLKFSEQRVGLQVNEDAVVYVGYLDQAYDGMPWILENSNPEVITVVQDFSQISFKGLKEGTAELTARLVYDESVVAKCVVVVGSFENVESISFFKENVTLKTGETTKLELIIEPANAAYTSITWRSSDYNIVDVDDEGVVWAHRSGTAVITASIGDLSASCTVTVAEDVVEAEFILLNPGWETIQMGEKLQMEATVYPLETTDKTIYWYSTDPNVATVSETGEVTGVWPGRTYIHAVCGNVDEFSTIDVVGIEAEGIILTPNEVVMEVGDAVQITATVYPDNTTDKTIVWTSSEPEVAYVSETGLITGLSEGTSWIRAICGNMDAGLWVTVLPEDSGVESILGNPDNKISIYTSEGILLRKDCSVDELKFLKKGIYIIVSGKERYKISL